VADGNPHAAPPRVETVRFLADEGVPRALAADVVAHVSRRLVVPCRLDPAPWQNQPVRLGGREQVDADRLLASLERASPGTIQVGLTGLDIGLALFTFVFGRAMLGGHAAVVSLARLTPEHYGLTADMDVLMRRAVTEILHELGHVAGLGHCNDFNCIMHFVPNVESIDVRGAGFCARCESVLPGSLFSKPGA
jgi:predicted Zn-dependent protease